MFFDQCFGGTTHQVEFCMRFEHRNPNPLVFFVLTYRMFNLRKRMRRMASTSDTHSRRLWTELGVYMRFCLTNQPNEDLSMLSCVWVYSWLRTSSHFRVGQTPTEKLGWDWNREGLLRCSVNGFHSWTILGDSNKYELLGRKTGVERSSFKPNRIVFLLFIFNLLGY